MPKKVMPKTKNRKIRVTDTTLRDAHQSLLATRMKTEDMLPIAPKIDQVGYWSVEMWGGATFDTALRYLREDPWERIRTLKKVMPNTPFQMLLRGQNVVGYRHYADDVVEKFVERAVSNGIDIFRIFDALNDLRNLRTAVKAVLKYGGKVEATLCYTISPAHKIAHFVDLAKRLEDMGADTLCIKDMAGILLPNQAHELVSRLRKSVGLKLHLHSHDTSGTAVATNMRAAEAGIDIIDTAVSSLASGTSQPPAEVMVSVLRDTPYDTGLDMQLLAEIAHYFRGVRAKYKEFESEYTGVDPYVLIYQIPGGMTSNLSSQLKEQNALDRMKEVLDEVPRVRKELGYPPLVTPSSQIVGTQATLNVITGERYKVITSETKNYLKGLYGKPPAPIDPKIRKKAVGDEEFVERRPADLLEPELGKARQEAGEKAKSVEDVLSYALFPNVALEFFDLRERGELGKEEAPKLPDAPPPVIAPTEFTMKVHGETYQVKIGGMGHAGEGGRPYFIYVDDQLEEVMVESSVEVVPSVQGRIDTGAGGRSIRPQAAHEGDITTAMPGAVMSIKVRVGARVKAGDTVLVVEAMKMETEVHSPIAGEVKTIYVKEGDRVNPDEVLVAVR